MTKSVMTKSAMTDVAERVEPEQRTRADSGAVPAYIAITVAVVLWGLAPVATRYLVLRADPLGVLGLRFAMCSLLYLPVLPQLRGARRREAGGAQKIQAWTRRDVLLLVGCGIAGIVGYNVPVTYGTQHVQAALAGILLSTESLWIAGFSVLLLKERPSPRLLGALAVGGAGVATLLIAGGGLDVRASMLAGSALILLGASMWGLYSVCVGPLIRRVGTLPASALTLWIGTVPLVLFGGRAMSSAAGHMSASSWTVLVLYGLGPNIIGMLLWNYGVSRVPASRAAVFLYLYPAVGVAGGVFLLGERATAGMAIGGLLVLSALVLTTRAQRARDDEPPSA
jgi:drug/metabolite transporter (DMT)-like permease